MFEVALEARAEGRGVVGSTSDILTFILDKTRDEAAARRAGAGGGGGAPLRFVLGTEAGMSASIVRGVRAALAAAAEANGGAGADDIAVEIVFPVASDAVAAVAPAPGDDAMAMTRLSAAAGALAQQARRRTVFFFFLSFLFGCGMLSLVVCFVSRLRAWCVDGALRLGVERREGGGW